MYTFKEASLDDVEKIIGLIKMRVSWMRGRGIIQWNETSYFESYPREYFEELAKNHELFIFLENDEIIAASALREKDERWEDDVPALYIHNFVSREKGAGREMLRFMEKRSKDMGKKSLRLDCQKDNLKLNDFYINLGFILRGFVDEGLYKGSKYEKIL